MLSQPRFLILLLASTCASFVACASAPQRTHPPDADVAWVPDSPRFSPFFAELSDPSGGAISPLLGFTDAPAIALPASKCNEQRAQAFLMRSTYVYQLGLGSAEAQRRKHLHRDAIAYRTRHYGFVEGFGDVTMNSRPPYDYTSEAKFFGVSIRMNRRVLVALSCVEENIKQTCTNAPYVPRVLDGLRARNTFHNNEVSNHLYGIAIDIDPDRNACCHCVAPSKDAPICRKPARTPFDHAEIPPCWVESFERYGFYWLGHDELEDTMHFEFLGDPNKINASSPSAIP